MPVRQDPEAQPLRPESDAGHHQRSGATADSAGGLPIEEGAVGIAGAADEAPAWKDPYPDMFKNVL